MLLYAGNAADAVAPHSALRFTKDRNLLSGQNTE